MLSSKDSDIVKNNNDDLEMVIYSVLADRSEQQDTFGYEMDSNKLLCVVCDGMGGHQGGKIASRLAANKLLGSYVPGEEINVETELLEPIRQADESIFSLMDDNGKRLNAGSTIAAVSIIKNRLYWASVGDSRVYLFRNNKYVQLTKDQNYKTYLDESLGAGRISLQEYNAKIEQKEALINYAGIGRIRETEFIDTNNEAFLLNCGDIILVMSDGVYKVIDNEKLNDIVGKYSDIVDIAQYVELSIAENAKQENIDRDNTTMAVIKIY